MNKGEALSDQNSHFLTGGQWVGEGGRPAVEAEALMESGEAGHRLLGRDLVSNGEDSPALSGLTVSLVKMGPAVESPAASPDPQRLRK